MRMSSAEHSTPRVFMSAAIFSRRVAIPSETPYWRARAPNALSVRSAATRISSTGKSSGAGSPPANEIMSGRSVSLRISRIDDGFIDEHAAGKSVIHDSPPCDIIGYALCASVVKCYNTDKLKRGGLYGFCINTDKSQVDDSDTIADRERVCGSHKGRKVEARHTIAFDPGSRDPAQGKSRDDRRRLPGIVRCRICPCVPALCLLRRRQPKRGPRASGRIFPLNRIEPDLRIHPVEEFMKILGTLASEDLSIGGYEDYRGFAGLRELLADMDRRDGIQSEPGNGMIITSGGPAGHRARGSESRSWCESRGRGSLLSRARASRSGMPVRNWSPSEPRTTGPSPML